MCQFPAQWCAGNSPKKVYHYLPSAAELECAAYPDAPDSTNNRFLHGCHHHRCHIDSAVSVYYYCHEASEYLLQIFQATVQHRRLKVSSAFNPLAKPFTFLLFIFWKYAIIMYLVFELYDVPTISMSWLVLFARILAAWWLPFSLLFFWTWHCHKYVCIHNLCLNKDSL
jgi:hypothetical protein